VKVTGIGRNSVQGDIRFADVLEKMGRRLSGVMILLPVRTVN
jgi:3-phosphoshikimate 1-carboxyvinyltransferase